MVNCWIFLFGFIFFSFLKNTLDSMAVFLHKEYSFPQGPQIFREPIKQNDLCYTRWKRKTVKLKSQAKVGKHTNYV